MCLRVSSQNVEFLNIQAGDACSQQIVVLHHIQLTAGIRDRRHVVNT
jgi:hypothetical protein